MTIAKPQSALGSRLKARGSCLEPPAFSLEPREILVKEVLA